jgi:L-rhamnose mutarotase
VGTEYERDMKALADPTTREWWKLTDPMQEPLPTRKEGEWWAEMEPLLCFDKLLKPSGETRRVGLTAAVRIGKENELNNLYKNIPPDVEVESGRYNFQNCQMYFKDEKVFCYYEYCGKDFQYDWSEVSKNEAVKSFRMNLCECLIGREGRYWQEMEEVFYNR